jgi:hypothetical protein
MDSTQLHVNMYLNILQDRFFMPQVDYFKFTDGSYRFKIWKKLRTDKVMWTSLQVQNCHQFSHSPLQPLL